MNTWLQRLSTVAAYLSCLTSFCGFTAVAEPMQFEVNGTGGNHCCRWIQATGEIAPDSVRRFDAFIQSTAFAPNVVRLHSRGGSLLGGIELGEAFRAHGFSTEVGSSKFDPGLGPNANKENASVQTPGICASACAYAFLGGTERTIDPESKLGLHRFYTSDALHEPTAKLFSGRDLDDAQKITSALLFYVVKMGIDARLMVLAAQAGPNEVRWITTEEAEHLRVSFKPAGYKPWHLETHGKGAIAVAESNDDLKRVAAGCTTQIGAYVAIIDTSPKVEERWLEQCRASGGINGMHTVFGASVPPSKVQLLRHKSGGMIMRFQLPDYTPPLTSPELLSFGVGYAMVCSSSDYRPSAENFVSSVRLAFRNCY
jgi:hypothetical protein